MNKDERLDKAIEYLQAARDGKQLQRQDAYGEYKDLNVDNFIGKIEEVRIKPDPPPEPKWRPWTEAERLQKVIDRQVIEVNGAVGVLGIRRGDPTVAGYSRDWDDIFSHGKQLPSGERCGVLETPESVATQV